MRGKIALTAAAAALLVGPFGAGFSAHAAQSSSDITPAGPTPTAVVHPMDCHGSTGTYGCGPGWHWDGAHCVPC
ncbi:hypothetical protein FZI85_01830 [Mycobacterium sp. CBMA293]|nr:hypothetical protein [Mycolicibacterium sp. CBMA 360]MUL58048.1 hypothetical protein [Mycolicibacterium sp. CBMA 335]MUL73506.1 hypothetical protein [Mycolicibacterium sp. CBMA 311]MUL95436.1 hypothetical protein [Mycolicibacterium sp. CBMA 230]MUM07480.1 hypothetical protein [Mycolicibacterium sp. CBMA 213]MUM09774.1 hypothetical protein [Mycolicibacterium sp. CBMA 293]MUM31866.1 hypothetical protein [Mycolicibacterium sp. CBMA 361]